MCASAYHTFSNFVSNSRKLKFRPIIIKRLPKPTFSWYVRQAKSIAFQKFLSFPPIQSQNTPGTPVCVPLLGCVSLGTVHTAPSSQSLCPCSFPWAGTHGWAADTGRCSLPGWPDLMALWGSPWLHTSSGLPPALLSNGLQDPSASGRPQALGLSDPEWEKL